MSKFLYVPRPVSRPEQVKLKEELRELTRQNKTLRENVIMLEKEIHIMRTTETFKKIQGLEKKVDDTLREFKEANDEHLRYSKEFEYWVEDTRSKNEELILKNEELILKNEELIEENSRLRVENEELKNTRLH